jgi:hypothetical protein
MLIRAGVVALLTELRRLRRVHGVGRMLGVGGVRRMLGVLKLLILPPVLASVVRVGVMWLRGRFLLRRRDRGRLRPGGDRGCGRVVAMRPPRFA